MKSHFSIFLLLLFLSSCNPVEESSETSNELVAYGVLSGDKWKVTNTIAKIFPVENDALDNLTSRYITSQGTFFGGSCDISEAIVRSWSDPWGPCDNSSHGLRRPSYTTNFHACVSNYEDLGCKNITNLKTLRYIFGATRSGMMVQFCKNAFDIQEVLDYFREEVVEYSASEAGWSIDHTEKIYNHFYPYYKLSPDEVSKLTDAFCSDECDFNSSLYVAGVSLCNDPGWIDL